MKNDHYSVFRQAYLINREYKRRLASQEEPLYTWDALKSLLNRLKTDDSKFFERYDINLAIDGTGMRGDRERFRQEKLKRKGKRNLFTMKGIAEILEYYKDRLTDYSEEDVFEILRITLG